MFKGVPVIPTKTRKAHFVHPSILDRWLDFAGIAIDCPPSENQIRFARSYACRAFHYQHWTYNSVETYEQLVGDECYGGINGLEPLNLLILRKGAL